MPSLNLIILIFIIFIVINIILITSTKYFNNDHTKDLKYKILDGIYFTTSTFSTINYGDIVPIHPISKMLVILEQMFFAYITVGILRRAVNKIV